MRYHRLRLPHLRRHQARFAVAGRSGTKRSGSGWAFDLAERLQTVIFLISTSISALNHRLCHAFVDDRAQYDRGKVMTAEMLEEGRDFGRYLDVDGDGIPYRTYPGTHPTKGSISPAAPRATATRYSEKAPFTPTTCSGWYASSRPHRLCCAAAASQRGKQWRDLFRLDLAGDGRGDQAWKRAGITSIAHHAFRSIPASRASSPTMILFTWWSRTATPSFSN